jgi:Fis1 N-terminal tetratricopeptide repeat
MKECMKARPNPTAKFNYAWALIRSKDVRFSFVGCFSFSFL